MKVEIDTTKPPRTGKAQVIVRFNPTDKIEVDHAAKILDMNTSEFMRTVIIQAARSIISETALEMQSANGVQNKDGEDRGKVSKDRRSVLPKGS